MTHLIQQSFDSEKDKNHKLLMIKTWEKELEDESLSEDEVSSIKERIEAFKAIVNYENKL